MNLKKILCVTVSVCFLLALASCKSPAEPSNTVSRLSVMLGEKDIMEWCENNVIPYVSWNSLKLSDEDEAAFPNLKNTFDKLNADALTDAKAIMYELMDAAKDLAGDEYNPLYLNADAKTFIQRADSAVVSYVDTVFIYSGGVHGDQYFKGKNFEPETGAELLITDVLTSLDTLPEILSEKILEKYSYVNFGENQPGTILSQYEPSDYQWTLDYQGITFWFSPYDLAAYAVGPLSAKIYFDEYPQLFNTDYTLAPDGDYIVALPFEQAIDFDLVENDGVTDTIEISKSLDKYGSYSMLSVTVNGETATDDINYAYDFDVYLVHTGDKNYIYSDSFSDNDYHMFCTWDINGKTPVQVGQLYGTEMDSVYIEEGFEDGTVYLKFFNEPSSFILETRFHILGTRGATANYRVNPLNGTPEMTDSAYTFTFGHDLVSKIPLDANILPSLDAYIISEGALLVPYQTDGHSYVDLKTEDGDIVRLGIDTSDWPTMIGGIPEDQCFEELLYAG